MKTGLSAILVAVVFSVALAACKQEQGKTGEKKEEAKKAEEKPAEVETSDDKAVAIVDRAIEVAGGLEALKAKCSAASVKTRGKIFGYEYEMVTHWKAPDKMVMDLGEGGMVMGYIGDTCWNRINDVVIDCMAEEKASAPQTLWSFHVMTLYPLKAPGVVLKYAGEAEVDGKKVEQVLVKAEGAPMDVTLSFSAKTGLTAGQEYEGSFMGTKGLMEVRVSEYQEVEGVTMASRSTSLLAGEVFIEEGFVSGEFGGLDEEVFARPAQATFGETKVRNMPAHPVLAVVHKGSYQSIGMTFGKAFGYVGRNKLTPFGIPMMVFLKDPANTPDPAAYETEVRIPLAPTDHAGAPDQGFTIKTIPATDIIVRVEKGSYDKVGAAYGPLATAAEATGFEITGPAMMATFSNPMTTPPAELIHELFFPVKKKD